MSETLRTKIYRTGEIVKPFEDAKPLGQDELIAKLTNAYFGGHENYYFLKSPIEFAGITGEFTAIAELEEDAVPDRKTKSVNMVTPFGGVGLNIRTLNTKVFVLDLPLYLSVTFRPRTWDELQLLDKHYFEIIAPEDSYLLGCRGGNEMRDMKKFFALDRVKEEGIVVFNWYPIPKSLLNKDEDEVIDAPHFRVPANIPILSQIPTRIVRGDNSSDHYHIDLPQVPTLVPV